MRACRCGEAWARLKACSLGADFCDEGTKPRIKCEKLRTSADQSGVRLDGPWCERLGGWAVEQIKGEVPQACARHVIAVGLRQPCRQVWDCPASRLGARCELQVMSAKFSLKNLTNGWQRLQIDPLLGLRG
nr:hypothetical protein Iba_chr14dCG2050 [Ipomoea batatas]